MTLTWRVWYPCSKDNIWHGIIWLLESEDDSKSQKLDLIIFQKEIDTFYVP